MTETLLRNALDLSRGDAPARLVSAVAKEYFDPGTNLSALVSRCEQEIDTRLARQASAVPDTAFRERLALPSDEPSTGPQRRTRDARSFAYYEPALEEWVGNLRRGLFGSDSVPFDAWPSALTWLKGLAGRIPVMSPAAVEAAKEVDRRASAFLRELRNATRLPVSLERHVDILWYEDDEGKPALIKLPIDAPQSLTRLRNDIHDVYKLLGVNRVELLKYALCGTLDKRAFQPISWKLVAGSLGKHIVHHAEITIRIPQFRRDEVWAVCQDLSRSQAAQQFWNRSGERARPPSEKFAKLQKAMKAVGPPPAKEVATYWDRVARRAKLDSGDAAKMLFRYHTGKKAKAARRAR